MTVPDSPATTEAPPLDRRRLFAAACLGMFTFGVVVALLGTLFGLPETRARLGIGLAGQGDLFGVLSVGLLAASLLAGPLLDRVGAKPVLVAGSAMVAAALFGLALARAFGPAALAIACLGFGGGWLNVATNALVSDVYPEERGRMLNLLGTLFGVGALFVPLLVAAGFSRLSVPGTLVACGGIAAIGVVAFGRLTFPPPREARASSPGDLLRAARHPGVLLLAVLLFLESGNEASVSGWASTYVGSAGWSPWTATVVLVGYWIVAITGRLVSARAQARLGKERLVLLSGVGSALGCAILLLAPASLPVLTFGIWLCSFAFASIFPTSLAIAGDRHHQHAGTVFGLLFFIGGLGTVTFPWVLGHVAQSAGVRAGMLIPLSGAILLSACAVAVLRNRPRQ